MEKKKGGGVAGRQAGKWVSKSTVMAATESPGWLPSDRTVNLPVKVTLRLRGAVDRHSNQTAGR